METPESVPRGAIPVNCPPASADRDRRELDGRIAVLDALLATLPISVVVDPDLTVDDLFNHMSET